jgi:4-oxalocrotonate tautomerase
VLELFHNRPNGKAALRSCFRAFSLRDRASIDRGVSVKNAGVSIIHLCDHRSEDMRDRAMTLDATRLAAGKERFMPLINVKLIEGVFDEADKKEIVTRLTDAMVAIEGEAMRSVTWVVIDEVKSGHWALGGQPLTASEVRALRQGRAAA